MGCHFHADVLVGACAEEDSNFNCINKCRLFTLFVIRGRPRMPVNVSENEVSDQTYVTVVLLRHATKEMVQFIVIFIRHSCCSWASVKASKE